MKFLLWALIAIGLGRTTYRFIKARRLSDGLSLAFWLALGTAALTGSPGARLIALGFLIASFFTKRKPAIQQRPKRQFDTRHNERQATGSVIDTPDKESEVAEIENFIHSIPESAQDCITHVKILTGKTLDYSPESLTTVDEVISKNWGDELPVLVDSLITMFGSYVGETLRRNLGGKWEYSEEFGCALVEIDGRDVKAFPIGKVRRRFTDGEGDSVAFFYKAIKHTLDKEREENDSD